MNYNLERFIKAGDRDYSTALEERKGGCKEGHWMWYIFLQLKELRQCSVGIVGISILYFKRR